MSQTVLKSLTSNGSTPFVQLQQWGNRVEIRSGSFSGTSAKLEFSTDGTTDKITTLETLTAGDAFDIDGPGYVRLTATGINTQIDLVVTPKARD